MKCYICSRKAVVLFEYTSSLSKKCREARCKACAKALRESDNTIHTETRLDGKTGSSNSPPKRPNKSPQPPHLLTNRNKH